MFLVLAPRAGSGHQLRLVPTLHVAALTDMSEDEMASFLAGLSKLIRWLKKTRATEVVEIRAGPRRGVGDDDERHFYLNIRTREGA